MQFPINNNDMYLLEKATESAFLFIYVTIVFVLGG